MKVILVIACIAMSFMLNTIEAGSRKRNSMANRKAHTVTLSLVADRRSYNRGDSVKLEVKLINSGDGGDMFVYGTLDWGYSASLTLHIRDSRGREIQPAFLDDALTLPLKPDDKSQFVKLAPNHFFGTHYEASLRQLKMTTPGRYSIVVEYQSPFTGAEVGVTPFFGKENGPIKSEAVYVDVLH
jgi:hypothetical protein